MQRIRFVRYHAPYNAGEEAGFEDDRAAQLIKAGYATPVVAEGATPDEPEAQKKAKGGKAGKDKTDDGKPPE